MDNTIATDFAEFITNDELFNSNIKIYTAKSGTLLYNGKGTYDKKPQLVQNEQGQLFYQGHKSILYLSMKLLTFLTAYSSLKGYYVEITDNVGLKAYTIENSNYNSNVNSIYCELKEA